MTFQFRLAMLLLVCGCFIAGAVAVWALVALGLSSYVLPALAATVLSYLAVLLWVSWGWWRR